MRSLWAVAVNTIKQALRMKVAAVFVVLLIVLLPAMGISMTGDGTLKGRLQSFISYGLSLVGILLCLLTIVVSVYSLTSDIKHGQIYTVLTKPVRRFELLLGKLLGVLLLDAGLLAVFSAVIYVVVLYIPQFSAAPEPELAQVRNEFYTARAALTPTEEDIAQEVLDTYNKLQQSGQLPLGVAESRMARRRYIDALTSRIRFGKSAAAVGHDLLWEFNNIKFKEPNQSLFVRFKYDVSINPPDLMIYGRWFVGDDRQLRYGTGIQTPIYTFERKDLIRTFHELEVPADAVADDGYLAVGFLNAPLNDTVVFFPTDGGLEVLYKADTFTANFLRVVFLIFLRLVFLACLSVLASTFLSFPVAILFCLMVFFTGTLSGFCLESFDFLAENLTSVYYYTLRPLVQLLPQFDKFSPARFLVPARLLSWSVLARIAGLMVCIKSVLLLLVALLIFHYKEIAKVVV